MRERSGKRRAVDHVFVGYPRRSTKVLEEMLELHRISFVRVGVREYGEGRQRVVIVTTEGSCPKLYDVHARRPWFIDGHELELVPAAEFNSPQQSGLWSELDKQVCKSRVSLPEKWVNTFGYTHGSRRVARSVLEMKLGTPHTCFNFQQPGVFASIIIDESGDAFILDSFDSVWEVRLARPVDVMSCFIYGFLSPSVDGFCFSVVYAASFDEECTDYFGEPRLLTLQNRAVILVQSQAEVLSITSITTISNVCFLNRSSSRPQLYLWDAQGVSPPPGLLDSSSTPYSYFSSLFSLVSAYPANSIPVPYNMGCKELFATNALIWDWVFNSRDELCPITSYVSHSRSSRTLLTAFSNSAPLLSVPIYYKERYNLLHIIASHSSIELPGLESTPQSLSQLASDPIDSLTHAVAFLDLTSGLKNGTLRISEGTVILAKFQTRVSDLIVSLCTGALSAPLIALRMPTSVSSRFVFTSQIENELARDWRRNLKPIGDASSKYFIFVRKNAVVVSTSIASKNQFRFTMEHSEDFRLCLQKTFKTNINHSDWRFKLDLSKDMFRVVEDVLHDPLCNDEHVYEALYHCFHRRNPEGQTPYDRAQGRFLDIRRILDEKFVPVTLLDIGCSEGKITAALGKGFGMDSANIHGCDVRELKQDPDGFTYTRIEDDNSNKLPYADNSFDLVVSLMVLHHIENVATMLPEITRVLRPGGIFVIREHDCSPPELSNVIDVYHGMYAVVWGKHREMPVKDFSQYFYSNYRSRDEWTELLETECGLSLHLANDAAKDEYVVKEGKSVHGEVINPYRFYYAVYKKPF